MDLSLYFISFSFITHTSIIDNKVYIHTLGSSAKQTKTVDTADSMTDDTMNPRPAPINAPLTLSMPTVARLRPARCVSRSQSWC
jgi:hypothetical protein